MTTDAPRPIPTAVACDALLRLGRSVRTAPPGLMPAADPGPLVGRVRPVRHMGSVDLLLEAIDASGPGEVLVIDNGGRTDEACIGDLVVVEAQGAGLAGIVVWGLHRDSADVAEIGLPVFTYGSLPLGPTTMRDTNDPFSSADVGNITVSADDVVVVDRDGAVFCAAGEWPEVAATGEEIMRVERRQAAMMREGRSLREQLRFGDYLERRKADPEYGLREHLRQIGGAIET